MTDSTAAATAATAAPAPDTRPIAGPAPEACVSCARPAGTPYCPHCGERRARDRAYSLVRFAGEAIETLTSVDRRLLRTVVALLRRPGELTVAYMRGERRPYFGPLQLFLLLSVAFFVYASVTGADTFSTPLDTNLYRTDHSDLATRMVIDRLAARGITLAEYRAAFDAVSATQAKSLVIAMVPPFACVVALVTARRRRYFVQALVFALHTYAVVLVFTTVLTLLSAGVVQFARVASLRVSEQGLDNVLSLLGMGALTAYLAVALRRSYGTGRLVSWLSAAVLFAGFAELLFGYRLLLFFLTFSAT